MTFHPTEFRPIKIWQPQGQPVGLIGWQGIIPAKAVYMVQKLCDVFVERVIDVNAIFARVDAQHVASLTGSQLQVSTHTFFWGIAYAVLVLALWFLLTGGLLGYFCLNPLSPM